MTRKENKQNCPGRKHCICTWPLTWQSPQKSKSFVWISCYVASENNCSVRLCGLPILPFHVRGVSHLFCFYFWRGGSTACPNDLAKQAVCLTLTTSLPCIQQNKALEMKLFPTEQQVDMCALQWNRPRKHCSAA